MNRLALAIAAVAMGCGATDKSPAGAVAHPAGADSGEGDAAAFVQTPRDALVGHRAPAVTLELLDGTRVEPAQALGRRPIYLKFWATWCVPCRERMPHLEATFRAHGDHLAVFAVDVGINDPIENVRDLVASKQSRCRSRSIAMAWNAELVVPRHLHPPPQLAAREVPQVQRLVVPTSRIADRPLPVARDGELPDHVRLARAPIPQHGPRSEVLARSKIRERLRVGARAHAAMIARLTGADVRQHLKMAGLRRPYVEMA